MDRTSKIIFCLIAAGLWANVLVGAVRPANAQDNYALLGLKSDVSSIRNDLNSLVGGICLNRKLC